MESRRPGFELVEGMSQSENNQLDVAGNRRAQKWTLREQTGRVCWGLIQPLFTWSPRPLWGWRRFLLRIFGAKIGRGVHVFPTVRITMPWNLSVGDESAIGDRATIYALGIIEIGAKVTISQGAHLCAGTHDYRERQMPLVKGRICIGNGVWLCADAFVGPFVTIGELSVVGARAVVMRNVATRHIVAGNPAQQIGSRCLPK